MSIIEITVEGEGKKTKKQPWDRRNWRQQWCKGHANRQNTI